MAVILSETSNFKKHEIANFSELESRKGDQINFKRKKNVKISQLGARFWQRRK